VNYHRPAPGGVALETIAAKVDSGDWIINGVKDYVASTDRRVVRGPGQIPGIRAQGAAGFGGCTGLTVQAHEKPWPHGLWWRA
jgi:hypothetical protein